MNTISVTVALDPHRGDQRAAVGADDRQLGGAGRQRVDEGLPPVVRCVVVRHEPTRLPSPEPCVCVSDLVKRSPNPVTRISSKLPGWSPMRPLNSPARIRSSRGSPCLFTHRSTPAPSPCRSGERRSSTTSISPSRPAGGSAWSAQRSRQVHAAAACSPVSSAPTRAPCPRRHRMPWSATCPRSPSGGPAKRSRDFLGRRTGVDGASHELDAATIDLAAGAAGCRRSIRRSRSTAGSPSVPPTSTLAIGEVWAELGLDDRLLEQPMTTLSGGEAARASLASLLLARFDVFLLDEPTNDLDLDGLARLESWVTSLQAGLVVVSHDREFLRRAVTHVAEIDEFTPRADDVLRRMGRVPRRARAGRAARPRAVRGVRRQEVEPAEPGAARAGVGHAGTEPGQEGPVGEGQEHPRTSGSTRPSSSPARRRARRR